MSELGAPIGIGRTAVVYASDDGTVVKLLRPGFPDRIGEIEATVAAAVAGLGLPAPRFLGSVRIDGRLGLRYERVSGPTMLDEMARQPWRIDRLARQFAGLHATMHAADGAGLPRLRATLGAMIERAGDALPEDARRAALARLDGLPDGDAVCHGDMHPGNVVMTAGGPVVIDWMTAARGDAAEDVARTLYLLRGAVVPTDVPRLQRALISIARRRFAAVYLRRYRHLRPVTDAEIEAWRLPMLAGRLGEGIADEREAVAAQLREIVARSSDEPAPAPTA